MRTMDTLHRRMKNARLAYKARTGATLEMIATAISQRLNIEPRLSSQAVSMWEKDTTPSLDNFMAWCEVVGASADEILLGRAVADESKVAQYEFVPRFNVNGSMGPGSEVHSEQIVDHLAFRRDWLQRRMESPRQAFCIEARGDSMEPTIKSGSICLVDPAKRLSDGVYVLSRPSSGDEYELAIKRIRRQITGGLIIESDNPKYRPEELPPGFDLDALRIVGAVVWAGTDVY